jgi:RNA polymerase sigma-70 factor (ECF subfamily)
MDSSRFDAEGDRALLDAVAALPLQRRVVVVLRYGIGMGPDEIAKVLDLPSGTVHSRLARALEQLREGLEVRDVQGA